MPITNYKTLYGRNASDLDAQVAAYIENDYQPYGEQKIITQAVSGCLSEGFYQAMILGSPSGSLDDLIERMEDAESSIVAISTVFENIPAEDQQDSLSVWNDEGSLKVSTAPPPG